MKQFKIWSIVVLSLGLGMASGAGGDFGLGFVLGDPSGLSAKIATGKENSVNLILGYDLHRNYGWRNDCCNDGRLYLGGDYVWYNYSLIHVEKGMLPLYYGPGVNVSLSSSSSVGVRGVVGLEYQFAGAPFDLFLEIGPGIRILPSTDGDISAGLGARFFF